MAYQIPTGSILEVRWRSSSQGSEMMWTAHYRYTGTQLADGGDVANRVAQDLHNGVAAGLPLEIWKNFASNLVSIYETQAQWIWPIRYALRSSAPAPALFGLVAEDPVPPNVQASLEYTGDVAARGKRGRNAIFGIARTLAISISGKWAAGTFNQLQNMAVAIKNYSLTLVAPNYGPFEHIIFHRAAPADSIKSVNAVAKDTIRVERRRTLRVGI